MRKTLLSMVTVVAFLAANTSPAAAIDFGLFASYWDSDDVSGAYGFGARIWVEINDGLDFEVSVQATQDFENHRTLVEVNPLDVAVDDVVFGAKTEVEAIPVDLGLTYSFGDGGRGFSIGGGATWAKLNGEIEITDVSVPGGRIELGGIDDEWGWYAKLGFEADELFFELVYRDLSATAEGLSAETLSPAGIPSTIDIDLSGFQAILGWRF